MNGRIAYNTGECVVARMDGIVRVTWEEGVYEWISGHEDS